LQRAHQALFHLDEAERLELLAREQFARFSPQLGVAEGRLQGSSPIISAVILHVSSGLGALRVMQNETWQLVAAAVHAVGAPSSMHEAYNGLARTAASRKRPRWADQIPAALREATLAYWEHSGKTVAAHRDVDQQFNPIATGCFMSVQYGRVGDIEIVLPDNPEVKSRAKYTYARRTAAVGFSRASFDALHSLVETVAAHFGGQPTALRNSFDPQPPIQHEPGVERATALWVLDYEGTSAMLFGHTPDGRVSIRALN
jgi:hypothetical protein